MIDIDHSDGQDPKPAERTNRQGKMLWIPAPLYGDLRAKAYEIGCTITKLASDLIEAGLKNLP